MPHKDIEKRKEWYRKRAKTKKYKDYQLKFRKERKDYFKKWAAENREKTKRSSAKYYAKNKAKRHAESMAWHKAHPWVVAYNSAKNRCQNKKLHNFNRYGGRGILLNITREELRVLWFRNNAAAMSRPTLDRIDNDGHYESSNCRFIEMSENVRKSNTERIR